MNRVYEPRSLDELWEIREKEDDALFFAGGTDLFVKLRSLSRDHHTLIGLGAVEELQRIEESEGSVFVGAHATHTRLLSHPLIRKHFPLLVKALHTLGSPPIRNMGTIGGNICTASPAGDALPPLYVYDAEVELRQRDGSRRLPIHQFITGPGKTALRDGELFYGIRLRTDEDFNLHHFEKVGQRNALAIAIASFAALVKTTDSGVVERARLAWGSVGPTVVTSRAVEERLTGLPLTLEHLRRVIPIVGNAVSPIDDVRASAVYRRSLAGNLALRLLAYERVSEDRELSGRQGS